MQEVALWQIDPDTSEAAAEPLRLHESFIELEKKLEDWIEANPDLVEQGLRIVGRQVQTVALWISSAEIPRDAGRSSK